MLMSPWHAMPGDDVLARIGSSAGGLSERDVRKRAEEFGPNALPEKKRTSPILTFLRQFRSPLIYLLFIAAGISFALGEVSDAVVILTVVLVNAVIGAFQEGRAERSMAALRQIASVKSRVLRAGQELLVEARDLVPGDLIVLSAGDAIAADARLLEEASIEVAEAVLTGESLPVGKDVDVLAMETPLADRRNMLYAGTHVTSGRGRGVVVATGIHAEIGRIAELTESTEVSKTPLERRVEQLGKYLVVGSIVLFCVVMATGLWRGIPTSEILMVAISQLVSLVPEGLPVAMTIALAVGMQRMAARRAIVRRLAAVESLGSTTVICTDKTGTLTKNEMTVTTIVLADRRTIEVTGTGYAPVGKLIEHGAEIVPERDPALHELLEALCLCNDAELVPPDAKDSRWRAVGDPTEAALLTLARKGGLDVVEVRKKHARDGEIPFDSTTKMMATRHRDRVIIKGAPEAVLRLCSTGRHAARVDCAHVSASLDAMAQRSLRVLAVAVVDGGSSELANFDEFEGRALFLGLVGQIDPPREEVRAAITDCRNAGIRTVMVTGDHKTTGLAVARTLGIAGPNDVAVDAAELDAMSDDALQTRIEGIRVFARVQPTQKFRIVEALQRRGHVVAMTGDGVNDAPALARSDIGVAMGITGTEVAKQASNIVITDDNFATIVHAVEEGRVVYRNLKKAILLLLSTGFAEALVLLAALWLGYPLPFVAVQILWNNVVTEGTVTINLIMEPREGDELRQPPIPRDEPILTRTLVRRMSLMSIAIAVSTLGFFIVRTTLGMPIEQARTATFTLLAVCEWFNVLNCRSETQSALNFSLLKNRWLLGGLVVSNLLQMAVVFVPALNQVFHTVPLPLSEVFAIGATGSLVLWVEEIRKYFARRKMKL